MDGNFCRLLHREELDSEPMNGNFRCSSTLSFAGRWAGFCTHGTGKCVILGKGNFKAEICGKNPDEPVAGVKNSTSVNPTDIQNCKEERNDKDWG
jgi:hypothetical protein